MGILENNVLQTIVLETQFLNVSLRAWLNNQEEHNDDPIAHSIEEGHPNSTNDDNIPTKQHEYQLNIEVLNSSGCANTAQCRNVKKKQGRSAKTKHSRQQVKEEIEDGIEQTRDDDRSNSFDEELNTSDLEEHEAMQKWNVGKLIIMKLRQEQEIVCNKEIGS